MKRVLFVGYGGGHVRMLVPVARRMRALGIAQPVFLGLNTARAEVEAAGFPCLGFADFLGEGDAKARGHGERLAASLTSHAVDARESVAYLGLSYADLVDQHGETEAASRYGRVGRQAFLPVKTLERVVAHVQPALVVATSAPRAEQAAILAAGRAGIRSACLVDLFAAYEIEWLRDPAFADRVCVLNERVRDRLVQAGRPAADVVVTGNPAFDAVLDPAAREAGLAWRAREGWGDKRVWLYASQVEPALHAVTGQAGDTGLPLRVAAELQRVCAARPDMQLVIRPHPSEGEFTLPLGPRQRLSPRGEPLAPLLHACDGVVVLTSTVALEAQLAGCRVLQVGGSLYTADAPYVAYGIADECVDVAGIGDAIDRLPPRTARGGAAPGGATRRVVEALEPLL